MSFTPTRLPDRVKASLWAGSLGALVVGAAMLGVSLSSPALAGGSAARRQVPLRRQASATRSSTFI